jgi:hypothetical protein
MQYEPYPALPPFSNGYSGPSSSSSWYSSSAYAPAERSPWGVPAVRYSTLTTTPPLSTTIVSPAMYQSHSVRPHSTLVVDAGEASRGLRSHVKEPETNTNAKPSLAIAA